MQTANFGFLRGQDAQLAQLGALAERYFRDDPGTAVFKLRQFAELLSKTIAAHMRCTSVSARHSRRRFAASPMSASSRKKPRTFSTPSGRRATRAAHETTGSHSDALSALKFARQLGIWFHRTYGKQARFQAGPVCPPPSPSTPRLP